MNSGLSIVASLAGVGFGIGIVAAGPIVDLLDYHWLFWLPMITTALAALGALIIVPESPVRTPGRIPLLPAALLSAWLLALLLGLSQGNHWGWGSVRVLALFAGALVLAAAWILIETRVPVPLIDMRMMRRRGVWTANVVAGFVGFGVFRVVRLPPAVPPDPPSEAGYGFSATLTESGHLMLPSAVASFLMGFMTARLVRVLGTRVVVIFWNPGQCRRLLPRSPCGMTRRGRSLRPSRCRVSARAWCSPVSPALSSPPYLPSRPASRAG